MFTTNRNNDHGGIIADNFPTVKMQNSILFSGISSIADTIRKHTEFCGGDSLSGSDDGELLTGRFARLLTEEAVCVARTTTVRELFALARRWVEMESSLGGPTRTRHRLLVANICKST